ncbi:MAG: carbohydrate kinase [Kiritimatiellaeota bacterium]|nr:carbohydrate kinase [Kiritimatiellota bacterium]
MKTNSPKKRLVAGLGEILWDLFPEGRQLGGAPANFAYHARRLGLDAYIVSAVGADALGEDAVRRLDILEVRRDYLAVSSKYPTGTVTVELDPAGHPTFKIHEHVAWDHIPWTPALGRLAARLDAVCFGSLCQRCAESRRTVLRFLGSVGPGCIRAFDINLRQNWYSREVIETSLALADVLKLNHEELPVVSEMFGLHGAEDDVLEALLEQWDLELVALTRGAQGSVLRTSHERVDHPGIPVRVVDTVGAGDAFTATLVAGLLEGRPLKQISKEANRLGAYVAGQPGATPPPISVSSPGAAGTQNL